MFHHSVETSHVPSFCGFMGQNDLHSFLCIWPYKCLIIFCNISLHFSLTTTLMIFSMEYLINFLFIKSLSFYLIFWLFFHILTDFEVYPSQIALLGKIYPLLFVYILFPFFFSYFSVFYCIFSSRISCILSDFTHLPICCGMAHLENLYFSICQLDWKISRHYILTWINHFQHQWQEKQ